MSQKHNISEQALSHHRSQQLCSQIAQIKQKIGNLSQIESEITSLQTMLRQQQSKTYLSQKKQAPRTINSPHSFYIPTPNKNIHLPTNANTNINIQNSNKKIKIYELKKKLEIKNKQYKDKYVVYLNRLKKQEDIVSQIVDIDEQIREEKRKQKQSYKYQATINADVCRVSQLCMENAALLENQRAVLSLYRNQKVQKIMEIKRLKKIVKKSTENTEPDQQLDQSIIQQSESQLQNKTTFRLQLTQNNTPNILSMTQQNRQQILIQDDYSISMQPNYVSFKKSPLEFSRSPKSSRIIEQEQENQNKKRIRNSEQIQEELQVLEDNLEKINKKYGKMLQSLSVLRKSNRNFQAKIKHISITLEMYRKKLDYIVKKNQEQGLQMIENIEKCQSIYARLRNKDGERGKIRGKLGIKVQNTRIIGIVNEQISLDAQILREKIPKLQSLSTQAQSIVKRVLGVQQIVSQNLTKVQ